MPGIDQYAVFGHPIRHSKSPRIHQLFADQTEQRLNYTAQEVSSDAFTAAVELFFASGGKGLNCTVPLKELAWRRADQLSDRARLSKAVNTLALQADGLLYGDNTDGIGLTTDLTVNHGIELTGKRILMLGAGGAARGIIGPLLDHQPDLMVIANRTVARAVQLANEFAHDSNVSGCAFSQLRGHQFDLILNATSASLNNALPPLPEQILAEYGACYDLAYANRPTPFVLWGHQCNASKSLDGLGMLVEQAAEAFYLWRGVRPVTTPVINMLNAERNPPE